MAQGSEFGMGWIFTGIPEFRRSGGGSGVPGFSKFWQHAHSLVWTAGALGLRREAVLASFEAHV